jgi:hypothetical protein
MLTKSKTNKDSLVLQNVWLKDKENASKEQGLPSRIFMKISLKKKIFITILGWYFKKEYLTKGNMKIFFFKKISKISNWKN